MAVKDDRLIPTADWPNPSDIERAHEWIANILPYLEHLLTIAQISPDSIRPPQDDVAQAFKLLTRLYDDLRGPDRDQWWSPQTAAAYEAIHQHLGISVPKLAAVAGVLATSAHDAAIRLARVALERGWGWSHKHPSYYWNDLDEAGQLWFECVGPSLREMRATDIPLLMDWVEQEHRLMCAALAASRKKAPSSPPTATKSQLILRSDDVKILRALAQAQTPLNQYDLEPLTELSRKTLSERLEHLRQAGLVHRPYGERGGEAITDAGRNELERHEATR